MIVIYNNFPELDWARTSFINADRHVDAIPELSPVAPTYVPFDPVDDHMMSRSDSLDCQVSETASDVGDPTVIFNGGPEGGVESAVVESEPCRPCPNSGMEVMPHHGGTVADERNIGCAPRVQLVGGLMYRVDDVLDNPLVHDFRPPARGLYRRWGGTTMWPQEGLSMLPAETPSVAELLGGGGFHESGDRGVELGVSARGLLTQTLDPEKQGE